MSKAEKTQGLDLKATSRNVLAAVKMLRHEREWSFTDLEERLTAVGHRIPAIGLRRIESGTRRVDVDDLTALAAVFDVSPSRLLMHTPQQHESLRLTGTPEDMTHLEITAWLRDETGLTATARVIFWQKLLADIERLRSEQQAHVKQLANRIKVNPEDKELIDRYILEVALSTTLAEREEQGRNLLARLREQQETSKG